MNKNAARMNLEIIKRDCQNAITLSQKEAQRFFKTSKNTYGHHDLFLGITVPNLRKIAKVHKATPLETISELITSPYNEERLLALFILIFQYNQSSDLHKKIVYDFYLKHISSINNWNLVDASCYHILGNYLWDKDRSLLFSLSQSPSLWERRIAIVSTWYFIRLNDMTTTLEIAKILLNDKEDLIHKATGWMLREMGKREKLLLIQFLKENSRRMSRMTFRYATEKLSKEEIKSLS